MNTISIALENLGINLTFRFANLFKLIAGSIESLLIISFLLVLILYFYTRPETAFLENTVLNLLAITILTDGLLFLLHLPRKAIKHNKLSFDPKKLTVIISSFNGEYIIEETIKSALAQVRPKNIIVVSDASTDKTAEVARSLGVRVFVNQRNLNKALSISSVMHQVKTPYVLVLDDDTLIEKTFIPTSLLDEGYDAVAFNVMPIKMDSLINKLQQFEYRKTMYLSKNLRGGVGAVGNVSGAIGLYRTKDLLIQVTKHSGQWGGEDQQRTAYIHIDGEGKGVTYTNSTALTKVPENLKALFKQRAFRWTMSLPELFFLNWRILLKSDSHYLLKIERAYKIYLFATDPIRILFFWILFLHPFKALVLYFFYLSISILAWWKIGRKDPLWIVAIYPLYGLFRTICRFIAHLNWFKVKYHYLFLKRYHELVPGRILIFEYAGIFIVLAFLWGLSIRQFLTFIINEYYQTLRYLRFPL